MGAFIGMVIVVGVAVLLLKGFDRMAGRGPKRVSDGIRDAGLDRGTSSVADEVEKLAKLRATGALTDAEFQAEKRKLLT